MIQRRVTDDDFERWRLAMNTIIDMLSGGWSGTNKVEAEWLELQAILIEYLPGAVVEAAVTQMRQDLFHEEVERHANRGDNE